MGPVGDVMMALRASICGRASEWMLAFTMFNVGWLLLLPAQTFNAPAYVELARDMPESVWGLICLVGGSFRLLVLGLNGSLIYRSPHVRAVLSGLSSFAWFWLLIGVTPTEPVSLLLAFLLTALLFEAVNVWRAAGDAANLDRSKASGH